MFEATTALLPRDKPQEMNKQYFALVLLTLGLLALLAAERQRPIQESLLHQRKPVAFASVLYQQDVASVVFPLFHRALQYTDFRQAFGGFFRGWHLEIAGALLAIAAIFFSFVFLLARQRERLRRELLHEMARDLHDETGAAISNISLLAELLKRELDPAQQKQGEGLLNRISEEADKIHGIISSAIKVLDPEYERLHQLTALLGHHAQDVFCYQPIDFSIVLPAELRDIRMRASCRHDFYLILKETLHNIARHAQAQTARIEFWREGRTLYCRISDDGCGFDPAASPPGNGLRNMERRARRIGARLTVDAAPLRGAAVCLALPLRAPWWHAERWKL